MNKFEIIEDLLQEVYDPDFPAIDIYNLGLIRDIKIEENYIQIIMTLTTPACPSADLIMNLVEQAINDEYPKDKVEVELTFDPLWSPDMIKDEDLKRMFE
ncbi:metal-sulfur cluster assembly factor [Candidatus Vampirococcus lugosii]|uniref:FeS assembly SUF system protein n=1 Tax=Candidatus Vampirococcus lugosii TaxID=2789015 RepID=A0ABS5QJV9_9BACT|nr:FeS assembly SUF system protein [Candidatus Vampirococcus lugosii]